MASTTESWSARPRVDRTSRHARVAVAVLFLVNGLTLANVVPWFPAIKTELGLSNTMFGLGLAAGPLGGLLFGMTAGPLAARFGSGRTATWGAVLGTLGLPAIALAPTWPAFAASMLLLGGADAVTDAAMNTHALRVQRRYRRSIINSFHALWSVGAVSGGLIGAAMVALGVPRPIHLGVVAVVLAGVVIVARRWQLDGPEHAEQADAHLVPSPAVTEADAPASAAPTVAAGPASAPPTDAAGPASAAPTDAHLPVGGAATDGGLPVGVAATDGGLPVGAAGADGGLSVGAAGADQGIRQALRTAPWLLLGFAALPTMAGAVEDAAGSWAAIHLRETLGATAFVAGLGFVAAQAMMVVGRVTGDRLVDRFGAARVARSGSLLAAVGMLAVVVGRVPVVVICGFALSGIGVSTLFPLGMAAAGNIPGVRSADGVAIASWVARLSFLVVPPVVGLVADAVGLRWGLALVLLCALVAAALSGLLPGPGDEV
jgi:MFS family permease